MFIIDQKANQALPLTKQTFNKLNFKERYHLQEWIDKDPTILGESLLIIHKEFDGFDDTNERLDLLAIDLEGRLVIIENKLDDTGKDVAWQALKYVSYCSSLSKNDIRDIYQKYLDKYKPGEKAEIKLMEFFNETEFDELELNTGDQRMILVAAAFRKEVTSTVMWLLDHNILVRCIKVTPYQLNDQVFLGIEQILPSVDTEEMRVKFGIKKQQEYQTKEESALRHNVRLKFWEKAIPELQKTAEMYLNVHPSKDNWISGSTGYSGFGYNCVVTQKSVRAELYLGKSSEEENLRVYNYLLQQKENIEKVFDGQLEWNRLDNKIACRISVSLLDVNVFHEDEWDEIIQFLGENIRKLVQALREPLQTIMKKSKVI